MQNFATIDGRSLKRAMKIVCAAAERRNTIPLLSAAKIELTNDGLRITGTDLGIEITADIDVIDGHGEWSACVNASTLLRIARTARSSIVKIEPKPDDEVSIAIEGGATYDLMTTGSARDFPSINAAIERGELVETFTNGMFAAQLEKVRWCVSTDETRYYINGVCWEIDGNGRRFVSTDGHRMAISRYSKEAGVPARRIIPHRAAAIIATHLAGADVKVFATAEKLIAVVAPGISIRAKLIDGTYPDYSRVLPKAETIAFNASLNRDEIVTALDQLSAIGGDRNAAVKFDCDGGQISVGRRSPDFGNAIVKTSADWPMAGNVSAAPFALNGRYLREIAMRCQGDISLHMVDHGSPFQFFDDDPDMTRVLMPMRA